MLYCVECCTYCTVVPYILYWGLVDGNYQVEIYIHLLDLTRNSCEKCNYRSLARIYIPTVPFCILMCCGVICLAVCFYLLYVVLFCLEQCGIFHSIISNIFNIYFSMLCCAIIPHYIVCYTVL